MGLSTDRIVDSASSSLEHVLCAICHDVMWHPVACAICEHSFCEACLNKWFEKHKVCPNQCEYQRRERVPPILLQLLSPLKITCKNKTNGCEQIVRYELLGKHEQTCDFEMNQCRGCSESLLKKTLSEHESKCDYVQITCNLCQAIYRPRDGHDPMVCLRNEMKNQQDLFQRSLTALLDIGRHQSEVLNNLHRQIILLTDRFDQKLISIEGKQKILSAFSPSVFHRKYAKNYSI